MLSCCLILLIAMVMPLLAQAQTVPASPAPIWHDDSNQATATIDPTLLEEYRRRFGEAYEALTFATREGPSYSEPQEELARIARVAKMSAKLADAMRR